MFRLKTGLSFVTQAAVIIALFGGLSGEPAEAGLRSWMKERTNRKERRAKEREQATAAARKTMPVSPTGMRNVLLVTKPEHSVPIKKNSTLAFIEFKHIEDRIHDDRSHDVCAALVASAIAQHLADLNEYKVVTRDHLGSVIDELKLGQSGSVNSRTSAKLGELIGADILIYGQVQLCVPEIRPSCNTECPEETKSGGEQKSDIQKAIEAGESGSLANLIGSFLNRKEEKDRSLILAQIQLIEAQTGKRVFTSSLRGEFRRIKDDNSDDMTDRELVAMAADNLADNFIDDFLLRREPWYVGLHSGGGLDLDKGIDYIQLGDCEKAEQHFRDLYASHKTLLNNTEIARLMYNHGISLMCSNRPDDALGRLWASLRLLNNVATFNAIIFTDDTIDRGRVVMAEPDLIIGDVREKLKSSSLSAMAGPPLPEVEPEEEPEDDD